VATITGTPASWHAGTSVQVAWSVANQGAAAATGPWTDGIYLSTDATLGASDSQLRSQPSSLSLAPGASKRRALTAGSGAGHQIAAVLDAQVRRCAARDRIRLLENWEFLSLVLNDRGTCCGVVAVDTEDGVKLHRPPLGYDWSQAIGASGSDIYRATGVVPFADGDKV
jgi:aspartate oxidase